MCDQRRSCCLLARACADTGRAGDGCACLRAVKNAGGMTSRSEGCGQAGLERDGRACRALRGQGRRRGRVQRARAPRRRCGLGQSPLRARDVRAQSPPWAAVSGPRPTSNEGACCASGGPPGTSARTRFPSAQTAALPPDWSVSRAENQGWVSARVRCRRCGCDGQISERATVAVGEGRGGAGSRKFSSGAGGAREKDSRSGADPEV